jgi:nucleoside-diphosphate-sugar epimerase
MTRSCRVLVTGATGFIGRSVLWCMDKAEHVKCMGTSRGAPPIDIEDRPNTISVGALDGSTDWSSVLSGMNVVIHTAARTHILKEEVSEPLCAYRKVNLDGTLNLAQQAADAGVTRFIFISSIKVNGERTFFGEPFNTRMDLSPTDPYAISKFEAEQGLRKLAASTGMEIVIIRPPLVYGPGVKGNFASMIKLVGKGLPLPLGAVHNKRSLVALDNLVDLIITCIDHPGAANQTFLVSDGEDISTTELLQGVAQAMGKSSRLIPVPACLLQFAATLLGKKAVAQRLLGSLQIDISHTQKCLNWTPPLTVKQGLQRCFPNQQD